MKFKFKKQAAFAILLLLSSIVLGACGSTTVPTPAANLPTQASEVNTNSQAAGQAKVGASVGLTAPQLTGTDISGKQLQLSDFKGKAVLLNFWTSW